MPIHLGPAPISFPEPDEDTPFDVTLAVADTAEDAVTPPSGKIIKKISLVNEGPGSVFLSFDGTATITDIEIEHRGMYDVGGVVVITNVSFIGESGKQPRVHGVVWSK